MLKVRIIPTLLYKDFGLVKGVQFDSRRQIGSAMQAVKVYNLRGVDELVFLDVTATLEGRSPDLELIDELADECFMPLTVGGGVRSLDDVRGLLRVGADKVAVNSAAIETPDLVRRAAERFGSQCVVVSIDTRADDAGTTTGGIGLASAQCGPCGLGARAGHAVRSGRMSGSAWRSRGMPRVTVRWRRTMATAWLICSRSASVR